MSDVTEAPVQDQIAESLLPESEQQPVEAPEAEQQVEEQVQEQPQEQEQQELQQETDDWLPSEQDKVFPDDVIARYAERMGVSQELAQEPTVRQLLVNKLNSDIFIQQQQQVEQPEPEPEPEPTEQGPQITREQYFANLDNVIRQRTDPEVAKSFHKDFLAAWQLPEAQQPMAFTQVMSKYALNLVQTFLPEMLQSQLSQQISQAFPGFGDMYDRSSHALAWDRVRNSDPSLSNLPAYGTKQFSATLRSAAEKIPGFDDMQFTDQTGKPLPPQQNAERKYAMLARIASGQSVDPRLVQQAAAAGARNARRADVRRSAGQLGSGKSNAATNGQKGSSKFQTNDDLFDDDTMELYQREHGRL